MTMVMWSLKVLLLWLLATVIPGVTGNERVAWKTLFHEYQKWTGYYDYYNIPYACNVYIHSVQKGVDGGAVVTFKARGVVMDMDVTSPDDKVVTFRKTTSFNNSERFPVDDEFQMEGNFSLRASLWTYRGQITRPKGKGFQGCVLHAISSISSSPPVTPKPGRSRSEALAMAVGIPVALAAILTVAAILLGIWAVKKGYLRHIPRAYKNFRNPRSEIENEAPPVTFTQNGVDASNVHI